MDKICVLMSTYNGEKYLDTQIKSILSQNNVEIKLIIRDDGSKDSTLNILERYSKKSNVDYYRGENLKSAKSFMELLINAPDYDYYAFADQDDFWENNKLEMAISLMKEQQDKKMLYFSNVQIVDENLNSLNIDKSGRKVSLGSSFIDSPAIGCTMVMNSKLRDFIINKYDESMEISMHDSWIYRIALSTGCSIIYDKNAFVKYRQHGNNVIGIINQDSFFKKIYKFLTKKEKKRSLAAYNILKLYEEDIIELENIKILTKISELKGKVSLIKKIGVILDSNFKSYNKKANLRFIFDVLFNRI